MRHHSWKDWVTVGTWLAIAFALASVARDGGFLVLSLLLVASGVPLLLLLLRQLLLKKRLVQSLARGEAERIEQDVTDRLAGVGRLSIQYPGPRLRWSAEFAALVGLDPAAPPSPAALCERVRGGMAEVERVLAAHSMDREPFSFDVEVARAGAGERLLHALAYNQFGLDGRRDQIFLVIRDVTEDYARIAAAEAARREALSKAEAAMRLARTDPLTGLANRRAALGDLDRMVAETHTGRAGGGLIVFDIDRFKAVNDRHGHLVGDRVLRQVAEIAGRLSGETDCLARIGGEEFLWILPGASAAAAQSAAERLRLAIEAGTVLGPVPPVTISAGWAVATSGEASLALFARADAALLDAKRAGRNQARAAA